MDVSLVKVLLLFWYEIICLSQEDIHQWKLILNLMLQVFICVIFSSEAILVVKRGVSSCYCVQFAERAPFEDELCVNTKCPLCGTQHSSWYLRSDFYVRPSMSLAFPQECFNRGIQNLLNRNIHLILFLDKNSIFPASSISLILKTFKKKEKLKDLVTILKALRDFFMLQQPGTSHD